MTNKKKECLGNNKFQNVGKTKLLQLSVYFITVYSTSRIYIFGVFILVLFKTATNKQHCVYSYKHINLNVIILFNTHIYACHKYVI